LYLTNYTIEPWPGIFIAKILTWELVAMAVLGVLTAALAKSDSGVKSGPQQPSLISPRQDGDAGLHRRNA
jgi:hypothetical protein